VEPFHRSTNGMSRRLGPATDPTAKQAFRAGQETPLSDTRVLAGIAIRWTDHCRPFQRSATGALTKFGPDLIAVVTVPVAVHAVGDEHDADPAHLVEQRPAWRSCGQLASPGGEG